ncbi:MAG: RDD family protein [Bacteroidetes bacterium]|nr:RDD family protein [Bacteroidota bacterium]
MEEIILDQEKKTVQYAGFWLRFVAIIIDGFIIGIAESIISIPLFMMIGFTAFKFNPDSVSDADKIAALGAIFGLALVFSLIATVLQWLYFALMESYKGATIGKMAMGLKVTDMEGNQITFLRATGRYFGKIVSGMILMIGYIMAGFTEKKQALHDMMSNCLVVKK